MDKLTALAASLDWSLGQAQLDDEKEVVLLGESESIVKLTGLLDQGVKYEQEAEANVDLQIGAVRRVCLPPLGFAG